MSEPYDFSYDWGVRLARRAPADVARVLGLDDPERPAEWDCVAVAVACDERYVEAMQEAKVASEENIANGHSPDRGGVWNPADHWGAMRDALVRSWQIEWE